MDRTYCQDTRRHESSYRRCMRMPTSMHSTSFYRKLLHTGLLDIFACTRIFGGDATFITVCLSVSLPVCKQRKLTKSYGWIFVNLWTTEMLIKYC